MKIVPAFASVILAAVCLLAVDPTLADFPTPSSASQGWGPSWVGGGPPGGLPRPTKFEAAVTHSALRDDQSRIGVGVRMWCDAEVVKGHQYELLYQLRVQTKKGEDGPLLGIATQPAGTTFLIASGTADDKWNGLEGATDITRKELSGMTNLPKGKTVTLRIEPQLLDKTTGKFATAPRTQALIVKIGVGEDGSVDSVQSLPTWIMSNGQYDSNLVLDTLADLDAYDAEGNNMGEALGTVLSIKDLAPATKLRLLHAVSKDWVYMKHPALWAAINTLASSDNAELQAAAKELLKAAGN